MQPRTGLRALTTTVLILLLLSGCTSSGGQRQDDGSTMPPDASATAGAGSPGGGPGTGRIKGLVVDSEMMPIGGADVSVTSKRDGQNVAKLVTDASGAFDVAGLEPATYVVFAAKSGYRAAGGREVQVTEGGVSDVRIELAQLSSIVPYHESVGGRRGFNSVACYITPATAWSCSTRDVAGNESKLVFVDEEASGPLQTVVLDMSWVPTHDQCAKTMRIILLGPDYPRVNAADTRSTVPNPHKWYNPPSQATRPLTYVVPRHGDGPDAILGATRTADNGGVPIQTSGNWTVYPWYWPSPTLGTPVDVYCMVDQTIEYRMSLFYVEPAPEGWSYFAAPSDL
jgi:hypothetical protein